MRNRHGSNGEAQEHRIDMMLTNENPSPGEAPFAAYCQYSSAAECEICSQLRDYEGGCVKEADDALILPPAAYRLVSISGSWKRSLEKCPLCGAYYEYFHWYEYSPMGNDEEAHLRRLSIVEALADLIADEIYPELESLARRSEICAQMVLVAINRSKLKRDTMEFKALQNLCKAMRQRASG